MTTDHTLPLPKAPRETPIALAVLKRRRRQSSAFAVYGSFVVAEFNNLKQTTVVSDQTQHGEKLAQQIRGQLAAVQDDSELIWRHPADDYESVFELDRLNLRLMNADRLELRAFALLERYKTLFSNAEFERITRVVQNIDRSIAASEEQLRAQTDEILASMHWYLLFSRARDRRLYELMKLSIAILLLITLAVLACAATKIMDTTGSKTAEIASFSVFLLMGGLGAATSVAWRLQNLLTVPPSLPETHLTDLGGLKYGGQGVLISVGCGVVFSFVLYMLFAGGVLTGSLFPTIRSPTEPSPAGLPLSTFFSNSGPEKGTDYAKLLFWLFLSGFAEKFVPDVLDRIRKNSQTIREAK